MNIDKFRFKKETLEDYRLGVQFYCAKNDGNRDDMRALKLFIRTAAEGLGEATTALALMRLNGWGNINSGYDDNEYHAIDNFCNAAEKNDEVGMYHYAMLRRRDIYSRGVKNVSRDTTLSNAWMKRSALFGYDRAQYEWGLILLREHGKPKDAFTYFARAANQGHAAAIDMAVEMLTIGWANEMRMPRCYSKAFHYMEKGVKCGSIPCIEKLRYIAKGLDDNDYVKELDDIHYNLKEQVRLDNFNEVRPELRPEACATITVYTPIN